MIFGKGMGCVDAVSKHSTTSRGDRPLSDLNLAPKRAPGISPGPTSASSPLGSVVARQCVSQKIYAVRVPPGRGCEARTVHAWLFEGPD
jgi:hypothetical protein